MEKNIKKKISIIKENPKKNSNQYIKLLQGLENFQFSDNCLYVCFLSENPCDRVSDPKKYIQKIQFLLLIFVYIFMDLPQYLIFV